jgi:hypothetical protein
MRGDLRRPGRWRKLERSAQELLNRRAPGEWNQAMMELGATVCTPRAPRCGDCPLSAHCQAYALGVAESLPEKRRTRQPVAVRIAAAVLLDPAGRTLLMRGVNGNARELFSNLWQFPAVEIRRNAPAEMRCHLKGLLGIERAGLLPLAQQRHAVTYRDITLVPFLVRVDELPTALLSMTGGRATADNGGDALGDVAVLSRPRLAAVGKSPVSSATRKIAHAAQAASSRIEPLDEQVIPEAPGAARFPCAQPCDAKLGAAWPRRRKV